MKRLMTGAVVVCVALTASESKADLVAYWNFNSFDPGTDDSLVSDNGVGTLNLVPWDGGVNNFAGSSINTLSGDPAGASLSLVGQDGNGSFIEIETTLLGQLDPVITFATRGTGTGFDDGTWSWSTTGIDFTELPGVNTATQSSSYSLATADFSGIGDLTNAGTAFFRYTLDGATSSSGNNRIDNLQINASAVPEPSTLIFGLLGGASLALHRTRRRPSN